MKILASYTSLALLILREDFFMFEPFNDPLDLLAYLEQRVVVHKVVVIDRTRSCLFSTRRGNFIKDMFVKISINAKHRKHIVEYPFDPLAREFNNVNKHLIPGGVLPYMGYIGMCRCEGYGFQAVYSSIGYINQSVWV